jgi:hypothetical protein
MSSALAEGLVNPYLSTSKGAGAVRLPPSPRFRRRWGSTASRFLRSPKRFAYFALMLLIVMTVLTIVRDPDEGTLSQGVEGIRWLLAGTGASAGASEPEAACEFVSTVEAYRLDLERLRKLYPESNHTQAGGKHPLAHHVFSPTGHLVMSANPTAPHPIPQLLAMGEKQWEELLARQSRSLGEAVAEYKRRYKRNPPRGFDKWWEFATERELVLPDEYDRINLDLAPFWALPKAEMRKRLEWVEDMPEVFILDVKAGKVKIEIKDQGGLKWDGTMPRAEDLAT